MGPWPGLLLAFSGGLAFAIFGSAGGPIPMASLKPEAVAAWGAYVSATEARIDAEIAAPGGFLGQDFDRDGAALRREVLVGSLPIAERETAGAGGEKIDVPFARVHHWRGAIFVPGATVHRILSDLHDVPPPPGQQEEVVSSRILESRPDRIRVFLRLRRTGLVTVVYNTEHVVALRRIGNLRGATWSRAVRIAEVRHAGTPDETEQVPGQDRGFLWRLNAYWRYEEVAGGVLAECESITLSRTIPAVVRPVVAPLVRGAARESMARTLVAFRDRFTGRRDDPAPPGSSSVR
jgi:hypothetical protein